MKRLNRTSIVVAVTVTLLLSGQMALAQNSLIDGAKNNIIGNSDTSSVGSAAATALGSKSDSVMSTLSSDKLISIIQEQGYSKVSGIMPSATGNGLQASAVNSSGNPVNLLINPSSGQVISALSR